MMPIRILYFAWVRDLVGTDGEEVVLSAELSTIGDLATFLAARGAGYAEAFTDRSRLRVAIDQVMATFAASIAGAREIAFFPPVTGG
jgi:sulfur-carrier protein